MIFKIFYIILMCIVILRRAHNETFYTRHYKLYIVQNSLARNGAVLESTIARRAGIRVSLAAVVVEVDVVGAVVKVAILHVLIGVDAGILISTGTIEQICVYHYLPHGVGKLGRVAVVIHDVAALLGELLLAAVGVCDFSNAGQRVVAASNGVLSGNKCQ